MQESTLHATINCKNLEEPVLGRDWHKPFNIDGVMGSLLSLAAFFYDSIEELYW